MGSKFYDIPFLTLSDDSDFACKDGELFSVSNVILQDTTGKERTLPDLSSSEESSIPVPDVDFAIVRDILRGWHPLAYDFPAKNLVASEPSLGYWTKLAAQLLSQFQNDANLQNLFVSPFLVCAVWKSTEGKFLSSSVPILLIPNSEVPLVSTTSDISASELEFRIAGAVCSLYFRMKAPEGLRDFVGKIESLEILVSQPLHRYDSYNAFLPSTRVTTSSYCRSLDLADGVVADRRICTEILPLAWRANLNGVSLGNIDLPISDEMLSGIKFYPFAEIPLRDVDLATAWINVRNSSFVKLENGMFPGTDYGKLISKDEDSAAKSCKVTVKGTGKEMKVTTRPLKLSGAGELKAIRRVFLRGRYTPSAIRISVEGSRDMINWWCISKRKGGSAVLLPHSSFRFYRVSIYGYLSDTDNLQGITVS